MNKIQIVDENNVVNGAQDKQVAHKNGLWHRIVCTWIYNSKGEVLIQKRAVKTDVVPGLWDHSCAGHVDEGETPDNAMMRELWEELRNKVDLELVGEFKAQEIVGPKTLNRFWYLYKAICDGPFEFDSEEVGEVKFVTMEWLKREMEENPSQFASGFVKTFNYLGY